jgi:hypothetical protein
MGDLADIVPPITCSPIDCMRGRGKSNATASAVASLTTCDTLLHHVEASSCGGRQKRTTATGISKRRTKDSGTIALLILSEKMPLVGCKTWVVRPT